VSRATEPVRKPDLDLVLDAVVAFIDAATYADSVRRMDERVIFCFYGDRPAHADRLRDDSSRAEEDARDALLGLLDHERVMRLIPQLGESRWKAANRAEDDYEQRAQPQHAADDHSDAEADGDGD
jgi:hypothetical protein